MTLTRRTVLKGAGAAFAALAARPVWAATELTLGDTRIFSLSDGHLTLPPEFIFAPMPKRELAPILAEHGLGDAPLTPPCNVTLMQSGDRLVLFDAGSGLSFQDSAGKLPDALDAVGLAPGDVTHVVFTHGHPDHLWGVLDDFDEPLFANAEHMIGKAEWDYWWNPNTVEEIGAERTAMAVGAKRRLEALEDAVSFFEDGQEILPGVAALATFGHTPGHMSFELRSGGDSVLVVGDAIGNHHVAFERPDWPSGSDQDQPTAAATRSRLLDRLAAERMRMIGFHLPAGGMGHVERKGAAYRFVPSQG
ncbi:MBL fold metallo-hydrolase [Ruegeria sediminis]|uniref:MBL fold metallo-hydrolase n=1 Tax=Ruegeria sediminis TaxID=2583820 RepID=A0ABY2X4V0_9RHOB|nr:MBL fold metallo-hydrolase [Ruegeria sediminis]TMV10080.1 MBL fold metallo-hydrolase [Ruegeria sediminis]